MAASDSPADDDLLYLVAALRLTNKEYYAHYEDLSAAVDTVARMVAKGNNENVARTAAAAWLCGRLGRDLNVLR